jgi:hypothetical protein
MPAMSGAASIRIVSRRAHQRASSGSDCCADWPANYRAGSCTDRRARPGFRGTTCQERDHYQTNAENQCVLHA